MFSNLKKLFSDEQSQWFLWTPVLFGLGIGLYFRLTFEPSAIWIVTVIELLLILLYVLRKNATMLFVLTSLLIIALGFANIFLQTSYRAKHIAFISEPEATYLQGKIFKTDLSPKGKTRLWLKDVSDFEKQRTGIYRITLINTKQFDVGSCIETTTMFKPFKLQ